MGGLGVGPKYLVDEYAVLDTRYWVLKDPLVAWVCYAEFFIMMPLEVVWYRALQNKHWSRHYWAVITGGWGHHRWEGSSQVGGVTTCVDPLISELTSQQLLTPTDTVMY